MNTNKAQIINIAGKKLILGMTNEHKTCASHYHAIKEQIADARRLRRKVRRHKKERQYALAS